MKQLISILLMCGDTQLNPGPQYKYPWMNSVLFFFQYRILNEIHLETENDHIKI